MDTFSILAFIFALLAFTASVKNGKLLQKEFTDLKNKVNNRQ
jgi:hypothetical protein